jgi:hypothetical protein
MERKSAPGQIHLAHIGEVMIENYVEKKQGTGETRLTGEVSRAGSFVAGVFDDQLRPHLHLQGRQMSIPSSCNSANMAGEASRSVINVCIEVIGEMECNATCPSFM